MLPVEVTTLQHCPHCDLLHTFISLPTPSKEISWDPIAPGSLVLLLHCLKYFHSSFPILQQRSALQVGSCRKMRSEEGRGELLLPAASL